MQLCLSFMPTSQTLLDLPDAVLPDPVLPKLILSGTAAVPVYYASELACSCVTNLVDFLPQMGHLFLALKASTSLLPA